MGFRLPVLAAAAALAGVVVTGCGPKPAGSEGAGTQVQAAKSQTSAQVTAVPVETRSISQTIEVTGALNTLSDVTVGVKIAGKIAAVYVREGDTVRAGQVVAQQDTADLKAQYDQAYANYLTAQTKLSQSKVALQNALTTLNWTKDQTDSAVRQAQAGLTAAQEQANVVKLGARQQEREQAQENVDAAKSDRNRAQADLNRALAERKRTASDLKRYQDLAKQEAIAPQQLDQAQAAADSAEAAYSSAQAALTTADSRVKSAAQALSLIQEGSRPEDIRRAQALVDQAKQALVTARSNREQIAMRANDVETARVNIQAAEAGIRQARAAMNLAQQGLNDARIVSPINGVVAERKVEPGMQLGAGKDVLRIVALNTIYFDAQLSENQYADVHFGQPVVVHVDALPGTTFRGTVSKIFPVASATARSFTVRIAISNEGNKLRPNLFARGQITTATHPNALVVPREAVLDINGSNGRLFVISGGKADERKVTLGIQTPRQIEITSGLQKDEKVITSGQGQLQNGDKIQLPTTSASSQPSGT